MFSCCIGETAYFPRPIMQKHYTPYRLFDGLRKHAVLRPEHEAFRYLDWSVSYADLLAQVNRLAHFLIDVGVRRGDRVGILMNRCQDIPLAMYGIMSAGAVFVPVDPGAPSGRIRDIVADCGIDVLISHKMYRRSLQRLAEANLDLEVLIGVTGDWPWNCYDWQHLMQYDPTEPQITVLENDLAYIMYTSGSTGEPKGIMHTHYSGLSYARLSAGLYEVQPGDCIANHAALQFDISTFGYLTGPLAGATTVILPEAHIKMPVSLAKLIEKERITIWYSVPAALTQLWQHGLLDQCDLSSIRLVLYGGEPFPPQILARLMEAWPLARFCNVYGPAEVNQCTHYEIPASRNASEEVPLGTVWGNTEFRIFDEHDQPVEQGQIGELLIRTATMMQGYWNKPELTRKSIVKIKGPGELEHRYYRTGDLVRLRDDGNLDFVGRGDQQVKIRGYRIELGEIRNVLLRHPSIMAAAVCTILENGGEKKILAAVVGRKEEVENADARERLSTMLRHHLSEHLAPYAMPQYITFIPNLPRTSAGKIDYKQIKSKFLEQSNINWIPD